MDGNKLKHKNFLSGKDLASILKESSAWEHACFIVEQPCYTKITRGKSTTAQELYWI